MGTLPDDDDGLQLSRLLSARRSRGPGRLVHACWWSGTLGLGLLGGLVPMRPRLWPRRLAVAPVPFDGLVMVRLAVEAGTDLVLDSGSRVEGCGFVRGLGEVACHRATI